MMPTTPPDSRHTQLRAWYERLTTRIEAADKDIGRALSELDRQIHRERRADLVSDREIVAAYLDALSQDHPLPGPWPPEFKTADLLTVPPFKSGRRDFYRHIPPPDKFVPRPDLLASVRDQLIGGSGDLALTSAITVPTQTAALHGMGGIGKSVIARALCDDPAVQAAFPNGILWTTLGQTPDLIPRLREWIDVLGGAISETAPTIPRLTSILAELMQDRACLLIVDDAWQRTHVEPFRVGGPNCRLLITTRDATILEALAAVIYPVPVMTPDQAVALLEEWAQGGLAQVEAEVKAKIVRRLGCLPLAVRLAGAQLRSKNPAEWLASFDARKLKARRVETVHDSLKATFALSLGALDPADRRLYVALAIFKENEAIPVVAIARLWSALDGRDTGTTAELLADLADRALLARSREDSDAVAVHDLLRDFMAAELGEEGRMAAHRALLDAYRRTWQGEGWHTAPDDGYLYDHLAYHLDQIANHDAAAETELRGLFTSPSWLHARVPQSGYLYDGYLADLEVAWHRSHVAVYHEIDSDQDPSCLADCVRYALIRTSVNSLARNHDPSLVARAVEVGLWSAERALSVGGLIRDPQRRVAMLAALLRVKSLMPCQRQRAEREGLAAAQAIRDDWHLDDRHLVMALRDLLPQLTGELLPEGLAAVQGIADEEFRANALAAQAPQLTGAGREQALQAGLAAARAIRDEENRARALTALAQQLTGEAQEMALREGLAAAQAICDEENRVRALTALAQQLTGEACKAALRAVLAEARAIHDEWSRAQALAALASQLTGETRKAALREGLATAQAIRNEWDRAHTLHALAPRLSRELLHQGLTVAQTIRDYEAHAWALIALAPQLTGEAQEAALRKGLALAQAFDNDLDRAMVLTALASRLTGELLREGLSAAQTISDKWLRAQALTALAPQLTGKAQKAALREGLAAAQAIDYDNAARAQALTALAPRLTGLDKWRVLCEGLAAAQAIGGDTARVHALAALVPQLTGMMERKVALREGRAIAQAIDDDADRAQALAALLPFATDPFLYLRHIRQVVADHLRNNLADQQRKDALRYLTYCTCSQLFASPTLSPETLAAIARHIIEITKWEWL